MLPAVAWGQGADLLWGRGLSDSAPGPAGAFKEAAVPSLSAPTRGTPWSQPRGAEGSPSPRCSHITWESARKAECRAPLDTRCQKGHPGRWVGDIRHRETNQEAIWGSERELRVAGVRVVAVNVLLRGPTWGLFKGELTGLLGVWLKRGCKERNGTEGDSRSRS